MVRRNDWQSTTTACTHALGATILTETTSCRNNDAFPTPAYYYVYDDYEHRLHRDDGSAEDRQRLLRHQDRERDVGDARSQRRRRRRCDRSGRDPELRQLVLIRAHTQPGDADGRLARVRRRWTRCARGLAGAARHAETRRPTSSTPTATAGRTTSLGSATGFSPFNGTHKSKLLLVGVAVADDDSTPLPAAMKRVGEYYRTSGDNSPYDNELDATGVRRARVSQELPRTHDGRHLE